MSDINDDDEDGGGVGLRWLVEYICYGYFEIEFDTRR